MICIFVLIWSTYSYKTVPQNKDKFTINDLFYWCKALIFIQPLVYEFLSGLILMGHPVDNINILEKKFWAKKYIVHSDQQNQSECKTDQRLILLQKLSNGVLLWAWTFRFLPHATSHYNFQKWRIRKSKCHPKFSKGYCYSVQQQIKIFLVLNCSEHFIE